MDGVREFHLIQGMNECSTISGAPRALMWPVRFKSDVQCGLFELRSVIEYNNQQRAQVLILPGGMRYSLTSEV